MTPYREEQPERPLTLEERLARLEARVGGLEARLLRWGLAALAIGEGLRALLVMGGGGDGW